MSSSSWSRGRIEGLGVWYCAITIICFITIYFWGHLLYSSFLLVYLLISYIAFCAHPVHRQYETMSSFVLVYSLWGKSFGFGFDLDLDLLLPCLELSVQAVDESVCCLGSVRDMVRASERSADQAYFEELGP